MFINQNQKMICLPSDEQLVSEAYRNQLRKIVQADNKRKIMTHRKCPTRIQHALLIADMLGIKLVKEYEIPLVDDVFPHERYLRNLLDPEDDGDLEADRVIDCYYRLMQLPEIAAHFE